MPSTGFSGFGGTFEPDSGVPSATYGGEFMIDSDDNLFGLAPGDSEALQALDSFSDPKAFLKVPVHLEHNTETGAPGFSPVSHRDSSSSASSRSAGSNSPKTGSQTSADMNMTDDASFGDWKPLDGLPDGLLNGDENYAMLDDPIDPMNADNHFDNNYFDFESASSSPSPPTVDGQVTVSPQNQVTTTTIPTKSPSAKRVKGHGKAQSVSLAAVVRCPPRPC